MRRQDTVIKKSREAAENRNRSQRDPDDEAFFQKQTLLKRMIRMLKMKIKNQEEFVAENLKL